MKDIQWFLDRVEGFVLRGTTEVFINDEEMAKKLFEMQSDEYVFTAKVTVHRKPPAECESCSA